MIIPTLLLAKESIKVAAGAGYKRPILEVLEKFNNENRSVEAVFGNMKQVTAQAEKADIAIVVGDKKFFTKKSKVKILNYTALGQGKVTIAFPKKSSIKSYKDLKNANIKRIAIPQPKKAIYGIAGEEFLKNSGMYKEVKNKLYVVATVPQVASYVVTDEVDAGIMNLTAALGLKSKLGGYILVPQEFYTPIEIVAGELSQCKDSKLCKEFIGFLQTDEAKKVFKKYGL